MIIVYLKKPICIILAALSIGSTAVLPGVVPDISVSAAQTVTSSEPAYKLSYYAADNKASVKKYLRFSRSGTKVASVTLNNKQVIKPSMSKSDRKKQLLYVDFLSDGSIEISANNTKAVNKVDVLITYANGKKGATSIGVTQAYKFGSTKTITVTGGNSSNITLMRSGKKIKSVGNAGSVNNVFSLTYKHSAKSSDHTSNKYDYIDVRSKSKNAYTGNIYVVYWDGTTECFPVKVVKKDLVLSGITKNIVSHSDSGDGFIISSKDSRGGNRQIVSCDSSSSSVTYKIDKKQNVVRVNAKPGQGLQTLTMNVVYKDSAGYKATQKITVNISREFMNSYYVGKTITWNTGGDIKNISILSGKDYVSVKKTATRQFQVTGVSGAFYSLNYGRAVVRVNYTNGRHEDFINIVMWPEYSTNPRSNNRWSYDAFINSGIVHWGGKQFSWYTMLATHENADGVSWPLPITNNPGNLLAYLPQSDWDRLAKMQKTNPKATMQDAFKPWPSDSINWKDEGFIRDNQGYICVAAPLNLLNNGTVKRYQIIATPWGPGRIYDACPEGSWDIYVRSHCFEGFKNYSIVHKK